MLRTLLVFMLVIIALTVVSNAIPDAVTANIDGAIQFFVGYLWGLDGWIHVGVLIDAIQLILGYAVVLLLVGTVGSIVKITGGAR